MSLFKKKDNITIIYNKIITNLYNLCLILNIKNPNEIMYLVSYMINKGLLSASGKYNYKGDVYKELELLGANVIAGSGVCRHIAFLTKDLLDKYKYTNTYAISKLETVKINSINIISFNELKKTYNKYKLNYSTPYNRKYNHISNLVIYKNKLYMIDANNMTFYKRIDKYTYIDMKLNRITLGINTNSKLIDKKIIKKSMKIEQSNYNDDINIIENIKSKIKDNEFIINRFYYENYKLYMKLDEEMQKKYTKGKVL